MSLTLPPSLRPWSERLKELVPELALALGPLVLRLATALGPFQSRPEPGRDDPEGFSGLTRRAPYDRLLMSEWALADELPDEFVRRAASGEHLFLELERRTPREGRRCLALFDAGPDQLGAPRLAHLALLVVLDRRATLSGAELQWQILQQPGPPRAAAGRSELMALLTGRSIEDPSAPALQRCLEEAALAPGDELWVIGGPRAVALAPARAGRLLLSEPWDQELDQEIAQDKRTDKLIAVLSGAARPRLEVTLPLPEPRHRTQLLRNPLVEPTSEAIVPPMRSQGSGRLRPLRAELSFSAEGNRLLCREITGALLAFPVPRLERRPARLELGKDDVVLALGWSHQRLACVRQKGAVTVLETAASEWTLSESQEQPVPTERPSPLFLIQDAARQGLVAHFVDGAGQLWEWPASSHAPRCNAGVVGIGRIDGQLVIVETRYAGDPSMPLARSVWFGPLSLQARHLTDGSWLVVHHGRIHGLPPRVWGVTWSGQPDRHPALLVSDGPDQPLRLVFLDGTDVLIAERALAAASSGGQRPQIAWLDQDGLSLYDPIEHKRVAMRRLTEEP